MNDAPIELRDLKKYFPVSHGLFSRAKGWVKAVDGVSFKIEQGKVFGLVGESGCGKSTIAKLILRLEEVSSGSVLFKGKDISLMSRDEISEYRSSIQAVFQDPGSSLSPRMRIKDIIREPIIGARCKLQIPVAQRVQEVMGLVGLTLASAEFYPHEFSGGQRQRVALARALSSSPQCIILDEPTSALDVSIRAQILNLLKDLQHKLGLSFMVISHDLAAVKFMSDTVGVMYLGKLVEVMKGKDLSSRPWHPYSKALLSAALPSHPDIKREQIILPGEVPSPLNPPAGCRFHPRCSLRQPICDENEPFLEELEPEHKVACHFAER